MSTGSEGSVTGWFGYLKAGDDVAAERLWERYFHELVRLARAHLRAKPRGAVDEVRQPDRCRFPEGPFVAHGVPSRVQISRINLSLRPTVRRPQSSRDAISPSE